MTRSARSLSTALSILLGFCLGPLGAASEPVMAAVSLLGVDTAGVASGQAPAASPAATALPQGPDVSQRPQLLPQPGPSTMTVTIVFSGGVSGQAALQQLIGMIMASIFTVPQQIPVPAQVLVPQVPVAQPVQQPSPQASQQPAAAAATQAAADDGQLYTVQPGDTLSALAERFLGSADRWPSIYKLNSDLIKDPDLILVGWKLRIPGRSSSSPSASSVPRTRPTGASTEELDRWTGGKLPPKEFIRMIGPLARDVSRRTGVPAAVILATAILETGWGAATIGDAKNLFGIKGTGPAGSISVPTKEYVDGRYVTVQARFRKYHSWEESVEDHAKFLRENSRYKNAFKYSDNPDQFAREIAKAGYATAPDYASKLINLMKEFDLYQWDR